MKIRALLPRDKPLIKKYLGLAARELSVYTFDNIYLWKALYQIHWSLCEENLCIFFKDKLGCFMYCPPLGKTISPAAVRESFDYMDACNVKARGISRIENIEARDKSFFSDAGYAVYEKFPEYVCERRDISGLRGNKFKSQRAALNYFLKNYCFCYEPFSLEYKDACINLYKEWMSNRKKFNSDPVFTGLASDSLRCLEFLLRNWKQFDLIGRVVKIEGSLKGFTFGFPINKDVFCISHETTDRAVKGLSQFIFSSFSRDIDGYRFINIMDDSGLDNLKRTKLSYHPVRLVRAYCAAKTNE